MDSIPGANRIHAIVRFGARTWELANGSSLTFGRSDRSDIVIPQQDQDLLVSRQAGRLTAVDGGLLVRNESARNSIYLQAIPGPEFEIKPLMTLGTMPYSRCRVVILGSHAARYVLGITCPVPGADSADKTGLASGPEAGARTTSGYRRLDMPSAQQRYLAALCEPLLTGTGARNAPASYKEIALRCHVFPGTVRKSLDALRQVLSAEHGIPGLVHDGGPEGEAAGAVSFLPALAAWAVYSGTVTHEDLEALDL